MFSNHEALRLRGRRNPKAPPDKNGYLRCVALIKILDIPPFEGSRPGEGADDLWDGYAYMLRENLRLDTFLRDNPNPHAAFSIVHLIEAMAGQRFSRSSHHSHLQMRAAMDSFLKKVACGEIPESALRLSPEPPLAA